MYLVVGIEVNGIVYDDGPRSSFSNSLDKRVTTVVSTIKGFWGGSLTFSDNPFLGICRVD